MTRGQRVLSGVIAAHLAAVFVGAVPDLEDFGAPMERIARPPLPALAAALDAGSDRLVWVHRAMWSATTPFRAATVKYLTITGQAQKWNMFCNPLRVQQQVRMGYRLRRADGSSAIEYEIVFPAGTPDEWKIFRSYVESFSDKTFSAVAERYRHAQGRSEGKAMPTPEMLDSLKPFTRYYAHRYLASRQPREATLTAVEFWWGSMPIPPPPGADGSRAATAAGPRTTWQLWGVVDLP